MADQRRTQTDSLEKLRALQLQPYRYGFFSALRMLDSMFPDSPRTGTSDRPGEEAIRLGQDPNLKFAPAPLASFQRRASDDTWQLKTYFLGVFGPNGPMPTHITEFVQQRIQHQRDHTFARFADIFHHRMATFFYRAWADSQPTVHLDRPESDRFAKYIGALCGLGMTTTRARDAMPDRAKLFFAAHLACNTRHADGLRAILENYFGASTEIVPFVSHWIRLPDDCRWQLGRGASAGQLGVSTTVGARVRDCQQRFRIVIGPLDYQSFVKLLPPGESLKRLRSIVDQYVGFQFSWVVQLVLKKTEVKHMQLGRQGSLGWTTWLASRTPPQDACELVIDPMAPRRGPVRAKKGA
ncbi:MAG: type VI secretion system baseplate subunit TssG [Pirellulaceae bacterium]|nr:type VI secretion system baseplate subunit TssG [Pirellulaceae bacterium]